MWEVFVLLKGEDNLKRAWGALGKTHLKATQYLESSNTFPPQLFSLLKSEKTLRYVSWWPINSSHYCSGKSRILKGPLLQHLCRRRNRARVAPIVHEMVSLPKYFQTAGLLEDWQNVIVDIQTLKPKSKLQALSDSPVINLKLGNPANIEACLGDFLKKLILVLKTEKKGGKKCFCRRGFWRNAAFCIYLSATNFYARR